jgi:hypothetical protein
VRSPTIRSTPRGFISQNPLQQGTGSSLSFAFQEGKLTVSAFPSSTRLSIASGKNKGAENDTSKAVFAEEARWWDCHGRRTHGVHGVRRCRCVRFLCALFY